MKTLILIFAVTLLFGFTACSQSGKDAPAVVRTAFTQKFPNATRIKWGMENDKEWEAEFQMDGKGVMNKIFSGLVPFLR